MIAALHHSRSNSSNHFTHETITFGWEAIEKMLIREVTRIKKRQLPRVPGLKESYVHRDPWTRLNVKPAKIMQVRHTSTPLLIFLVIMTLYIWQQEHVLAELQEYATQTPPPADALSVMKTVAYLKACNQPFERAILGKGVFIKSLSNPILVNMDEGFMYFAKWLDYELSRGICLIVTAFHICMFIHVHIIINSRIRHHTDI